jgi:hypothetical protein
LWLFWIAPLIRGGAAGLLYPMLFGEAQAAPSAIEAAAAVK